MNECLIRPGYKDPIEMEEDGQKAIGAGWRERFVLS